MVKWPLFTVLVAVTLIVCALLTLWSPAGMNTHDPSLNTSAMTTRENSPAPTEEPVPKKLTATYSGPTEAETVIGADSPFSVSVLLSDGSSESVTDWTIENPGTLEASRTYSATIVARGLSVIVPIECTTIDFGILDEDYPEIDEKKLNSSKESYYGQKAKGSFMVDHIVEAANGTTELWWGRDVGNPRILIIVPRELGDQVNDHTQVTFYGEGVSNSWAESAGARTHCFKAKALRIDSRELEQYVKENEISEARR